MNKQGESPIKRRKSRQIMVGNVEDRTRRSERYIKMRDVTAGEQSGGESAQA